MKKKEIYDLILRYFVLLVLGVFSSTLFYFIFTPLTVYPVFWFVSIFDSGAKLLEGNVFFFEGIYFEIIPACVAGAAYYLLFILNLTTPMNYKKRLKSLLFLVFVFLAANILRIVLFANLAASGFQYFDVSHIIVWYFGSTFLVALVWFANVRLFKIVHVPIYSDFVRVIKDVRGGKRGRRKRKK